MELSVPSQSTQADQTKNILRKNPRREPGSGLKKRLADWIVKAAWNAAMAGHKNDGLCVGFIGSGVLVFSSRMANRLQKGQPPW